MSLESEMIDEGYAMDTGLPNKVIYFESETVNAVLRLEAE